MRRPQWILALLFALLVAAVFAWLGQWQMGNAVRTETAEVVDTETVRPLTEVSEPNAGVTDVAAGTVVEVAGYFQTSDIVVVAPRENAGESGAWVVGNLAALGDDPETPANLAVAIGWAPSVEAAEEAAQRFASQLEGGFSVPDALEGRYMPPEGTSVPKPDEDPQALTTMSPAQLANVWNQVEGPVYSGFLVMHPTTDTAEQILAEYGLDPIDSVPPLPPEQVNWLNVFYAIEWVVFACFAVFFWFRLTRDAWEKEHELKLLSEAEGSGETEQ